MSLARRPWLVVVALAFVVVPLVIEVSRKEKGGLEFPSEEWRDPELYRATSPFPRPVTFGARDRRNTSIPRRPRRVVAASVFSAEVLLAALPREQLVGVHVLAADARYSYAAKQVGDVPMVGAEPEQLLSTHPDLVITDEFTKAETQQLLERAGVTVVRTQPIHSAADIADNIRLLGWVTGCDAAAERLVVELENRTKGLASAVAIVSDWRTMTLDGALDTYGKGSLVDEVIRAAGAINVAAEHGVGPYRKLDVESVLAWRPDAIIVAGDSTATTEVPEWLRQTPGLALLPCVQKKRIVYVPGALLGSTSHHVVGAAEMIQAQLRRWGKP